MPNQSQNIVELNSLLGGNQKKKSCVNVTPLGGRAGFYHRPPEGCQRNIKNIFNSLLSNFETLLTPLSI